MLVKRKAYTRKDGTRVKATSYQTKDRGKPGRTTSKDRWFAPSKHTGWRKTQSAETRRTHLLESTDHRRSLHDRYVEAGRMIQQLANVTTDRETKELATKDAQYFFQKARK